MIGVDLPCVICGQPIEDVVTQAPHWGVGTRGNVACKRGHQHLLNVTLTQLHDPDDNLPQRIHHLIQDGHTIADACRTLGTHTNTYYRHRKAQR